HVACGSLLCCYVDLPSLHSFPTRRSSDLRRQLEDKKIAPTPERMIPKLVPELIHVFALPWFASSIQSETAAPYGGDTRPVLAPANNTPKISTHTFGVIPINSNPIKADKPAKRIILLGPSLVVNTVASTMVKQ